MRFERSFVVPSEKAFSASLKNVVERFLKPSFYEFLSILLTIVDGMFWIDINQLNFALLVYSYIWPPFCRRYSFQSNNYAVQ